MAASWRERLAALRDRWFGSGEPEPPAAKQVEPETPRKTPPTPDTKTVRSKKTGGATSSTKKRQPATSSPRAPKPVSKAPSAPARELPVVAINFGIDFGTSFTKVCFRDVGTEESGIVAFGAKRGGVHLLPTIVALDSEGHLFASDEVPKGVEVVRIPYLKMRLAGGTFGDRLPVFSGIDLNSAAAVRALAAWFLARVLKRSQEWLAKSERDRLKNRRAVWSANVGVPVEHYDSDVLSIFREVLGVAWVWVKNDRLPATITELLNAYEACLPELESEIADFHAVPEIAAAVQSFVMSREAEPGIYVYFDIGGGTIDGVAFNYVNHLGERRINFYSGKVDPLGMSALASALGDHTGAAIEPGQLEALLADAGRNVKADFADKVQRLVAHVIVTAKRKDGRNWQRDINRSRSYERKFIGRLEPSQMQPLILFLGGGGARAKWYQKAISATYKDYKHHNAGIPPYKLIEVPKPADFAMSSLGDDEFLRFAISYGLSIPFGEGPDIGLPSQFEDAERPRAWRPPGLVDYMDSKDAYD